MKKGKKNYVCQMMLEMAHEEAESKSAPNEKKREVIEMDKCMKWAWKEVRGIVLSSEERSKENPKEGDSNNGSGMDVSCKKA